MSSLRNQLPSDIIDFYESYHYALAFYRDQTSFCPRKNEENLFQFSCFHQDYAIGDQHSFSTLDSFLDSFLSSFDHEELIQNYLKKEFQKMTREEKVQFIKQNHIIEPLYLYDHGALSISNTSFGCRFDSGFIGYAYASFEKIKQWYGELTDLTLEKAKNQFQNEIKRYDHYLQDQVYGYELYSIVPCHCHQSSCEKKELELLDSCFGFYGMEEMDVHLQKELSQLRPLPTFITYFTKEKKDHEMPIFA
jgi:hypothetical protein